MIDFTTVLLIFVEVKSGKSSLSSREKGLKEVIESRNVSWEEFRI